MLSTIRRVTNTSVRDLPLKKKLSTNLIRRFVSTVENKDVERTKIDPNLTLERRRRPPSNDSDSDKRPVVLLLSWLAAKQKHLGQFSKVYLRSGCDVLRIELKPLQILLPTAGAQVVAKNVVDFLQSDEYRHRPILVHGFSTGGYLYSEILLRMITAEATKGEITGRIIGQIYDSMADIHNIPEGFSKALLPHGSLVQRGLEKALTNYLKVMEGPATQHYRRASRIFHRNPVNTPTLFIYSHTDTVGDAATIEGAIRCLREEMGYGNIYSKAFDDSPHVSHMYRHKEEYLATLRQFLERIDFFRDRFSSEGAEVGQFVVSAKTSVKE